MGHHLVPYKAIFWGYLGISLYMALQRPLFYGRYLQLTSFIHLCK